MTIYLYVKTHNKTGLKYLGKTSQEPFRYLGSGVRWRKHLKKHGIDISTEILCESHDPQYIKEQGIYYSLLWDVVNSKEWANLKIEEGDGGFSHLNTGDQAHIDRCSRAGKKAYVDLKKHRRIWTKEELRKISVIARARLAQLRKDDPERFKKIYEERSMNYQGSGNPMFGKIWCVDLADPTNLAKRIVVDPNCVPDGYLSVDSYKDSLKCKTAPCYGKMWIHNPLTKQHKYINKIDTIPSGWYKGRRLDYYRKDS